MIITEKAASETAKDYAMRTLLNNIILFNLKPGEKLIESELCEQCQLSRTPIREAILQLSQRRLIDIHPKQGTYVSKINPKSIYEFIEFRAVIEGKLSQIACDVMTPEDIERLKEIYALWQCHGKTGSSAKMHMYDKAFHEYIYTACNKHYWYHIVSSNMYQYDRVLVLMQDMHYENLSDDHLKIIEAIEAKDKEAAYNIIVTHATRFNDFESTVKARYPEYFTT